MKNYRKIWEDANGPIPKDELGRSYEIHHIDGNRKNNDLSNLMCVSIQEHYDIHKNQKDYCAAFRISQRLNISNEERLECLNNLAESKRGNKIWLGRKHTIETKLKISKSVSGEKSPCFGRTGNKHPMFGVKGKNNPRSKPVMKYDKNGLFIAEYSSAVEAAEKTNQKTSIHIGEVCRGRRKYAGGFIWKFK